MTEAVAKPQRPTSITVICIIGFVGALISVPLLFTSIALNIGAWYPPYLAFSIVLGLTSMIGMWMMKKWGAYLYTGMAVVNQFILLATNLWSPFSLILVAVVVFFALRSVGKMS
jgi:hypothetical protein